MNYHVIFPEYTFSLDRHSKNRLLDTKQTRYPSSQNSNTHTGITIIPKSYVK